MKATFILGLCYKVRIKDLGEDNTIFSLAKTAATLCLQLKMPLSMALYSSLKEYLFPSRPTVVVYLRSRNRS
jgi:hypothetical protein